MRLIDADELKVDMVEKVFCGDGTYKVFGYSKSQIDSAPTISTEPKAPNEPLTMDELREMDGEWVWIELTIPLHRIYSGYYVKKSQLSNEEIFCCGYPHSLVVNLKYSGCGDSWLAYRRKPEEVTT